MVALTNYPEVRRSSQPLNLETGWNLFMIRYGLFIQCRFINDQVVHCCFFGLGASFFGLRSYADELTEINTEMHSFCNLDHENMWIWNRTRLLDWLMLASYFTIASEANAECQIHVFPWCIFQKEGISVFSSLIPSTWDLSPKREQTTFWTPTMNRSRNIWWLYDKYLQSSKCMYALVSDKLPLL